MPSTGEEPKRQKVAYKDLLIELRDKVFDAITEQQLDDPVLATLVELALIEIDEGRFCFPNPRTEPVFWRRHFRKWVKEAIEERRETQLAFNAALDNATGKGR